MPKKKGPVDTRWLEKDMADHPENYFSEEETERRMSECLRRLGRVPARMNMTTGQNLQEPFLLDEDLKARGYPCACGFE